MTEWREFKKEEFERDPILEEEYNKMLPVKLSADIIRFRKRRGLTQSQLAMYAGTSQSAISRLESGEYLGISVRNLKKIADIMGIKMEIRFYQPGEKENINISSLKRTTG